MQYTFSSDVWSLGCIVHELSCLEPSYTETNKDHLIDKLSKIPYNANVIPECYSSELKIIIKEMLNFDPMKRPSSETMLEKGKRYIRVYDGSEHEEEWENIRLSRKRMFYYTNCSIYKGEYNNDILNGEGILCYIRGNRYEGGFKNPKRSGKGTQKFVDGSNYEGD